MLCLISNIFLLCADSWFLFWFVLPGALVLLGSARRQSALPELGGRAVPGKAAPATVAAT